jgi:hypothetical protein
MYGSAIAETKRLCERLEKGVGELERVAKEEGESLEGRATLEIDGPVMGRSLSVTWEISRRRRCNYGLRRLHLG